MTGANAKIKRILVRQNGQEKQVRPYRYNPGSNTLAYYPLNGDIKDYSGNGYNGTWSTGTAKYNTLSSGLKVAEFSGGVSRVTTTFSGTPKTVSIWVYKSTSLNDPQVNGWKQIIGQNNIDQANGWRFRFVNTSYRPNKVYYQDGASVDSSSDSIVINYAYYDKWIHLLATTDGSKTYFYMNGEYKGVLNKSISSYTNLWMGTAPYDNSDYVLYGYISDVILENKTWTQSEIQDYYNKSKGYYGL